MQEPVLERRTLDLDVVGELEDALERARCDTLVEDLAGLLLVLRLLIALDREGVFLAFDRKIALAETGNRDRDAIGVLARALDVVGRIARGRLRSRPASRRAGRNRRWNDRGELDQKFAWHNLVVERNAIGPPQSRTGSLHSPHRGLCNADVGAPPRLRKRGQVLEKAPVLPSGCHAPLHAGHPVITPQQAEAKACQTGRSLLTGSSAYADDDDREVWQPPPMGQAYGASAIQCGQVDPALRWGNTLL